MYKFRYFFDFGSGICLWSANDAARERFDYPVEIYKLPLSSTLNTRVTFILAWHNTFLDWDHAPQPSRWCDRELAPFSLAAQEVLQLLREELGAEFEIVDESETAVQSQSDH